jgi:hypothetical protein
MILTRLSGCILKIIGRQTLTNIVFWGMKITEPEQTLNFIL